MINTTIKVSIWSDVFIDHEPATVCQGLSERLGARKKRGVIYNETKPKNKKLMVVAFSK